MPYDTSQLPALSAVLGNTAPPARDSLGAILGSSAIQAYGGLRYGLPAAVERVAGTLTPEDEKYYAAWNQQKQDQASALAPTGAANVSDLPLVGSGKVGFGRFIAENIAAMAPQVGATVVGGLLGGVPGAVAADAPFFAGQNASRALTETGGVDTGQAIRSLASAPVQAALDVFGERYMPGAGAFLGPLAHKVEGNVLTRVVKSGLEGAVAEAVSETGQQALERYSAGLPMTTPDAQRELVNSFGTAFFLGGALGGAGGVFHKAVAGKPTSEITNDTMSSLVDAVATPVTTPPPSPGKGFPASQFNDSGATFSKVPPVAPEPVNPFAPVPLQQPYELGQLNLPQGPGFQPSTGPVQFGTSGPQVTAPTPAPEQLGVPEGAVQQTLPQGPPTSAFPAGYQPNLYEPNSYDELSAMLKQQPTATLQAVVAKANKTSGAVAPEQVEAVQRELASRAESSTGAAAVSTPDKPFTFADATQGVRLNQDIKKLQGASEEDFHAGIRKLLEDGDTRKGTLDIAERLGILNDQAAAPAGPVENVAKDPLHSLLMDQPEAARNAQVALLDKNARADLEAKVVAAIGEPTPAGLDEKTAQSYSDRLLDLGEQMGLVDPKGGGLTDRGKALAIKEPVAPEELAAATQAAVAQNPKLDVETFEAGYQGIPVPKRTNLSPVQQLSYEAGKAAKAPGVVDAATSADVMQERPVAIDDRDTSGASWDKAPNQDTQQDLAQQIEALKAPRETTTAIGTKELRPAAPDTEINALQQMVARQAPPEEIAQAIQHVDQGGSLFAQPQESAPAAHAGEVTVPTVGGDTVVATRGAPTAQSIARAQLKARDEINAAHDAGQITTEQRDVQLAQLRAGNAVAEDLGLGQQARREEVAAAKRARAEAQTARKVEKLRGEVREAFNSGDIDRVKFMRLTSALNSHNTEQVTKELSRPAADQGGVSMPDAVALELQLEGKRFTQVLDYLRDNAPNEFTKAVMARTHAAIGMLERAGMKFDFKVVHNGDPVPAEMTGARALTLAENGTTTVYVNGVDVTGKVGWDYKYLAHEMVHAATAVAIFEGSEPKNANTQIGRATADLRAVFDHIKAHFQNVTLPGNTYNLTPFEKEIADHLNNALDDTDELVAWTLTDPRMQEYLDGIQFTTTQTLWGRFIEAMRKFLRLSDRYDTALVEVLRASERLMTAPEPEFHAAAKDGWVLQSAVRDGIPRSVEETTQVLKDVVPKLGEAVDKLPLQSTAAAFRRVLMGAQTIFHLAEQWGAKLPALRDIYRIDNERHATSAKLSQLHNVLYQQIAQAPKEHQDRLNRIMRLTEYGADVKKLWKDQEWLHDQPNSDLVKQELQKAQTDYNNLKRVGLGHLYDDAAALNKMLMYMELATGIQGLVERTPEYKLNLGGVDTNAVAAFRENLDASASPQAGLKYWKDKLDAHLKVSKDYIAQERGNLASLSKTDQGKAERHLNPLETQIKTVDAAMTRMEQVPYFHLGRHGDQFLSFAVRSKNGVADRAAVAKVAQEFADAGHSVFVSTANSRPGMFMRFANRDQMAGAEAVIRRLQGQGLIDTSEETGKPILAGPRDAGYVGTRAKAAWLDELVAQVKASPAFETEGLTKDEAAAVRKQRDAYVGQLEQLYLDAQSDNSLAKVMTRRKSVPGSDGDMIRSFATRYQMSAQALANMDAAPKNTEALASMRASINEARNIDSAAHKDVQTLFDLTNEIIKRQGQRGDIEKAVVGDKLRAVTNAMFLGLSPGYVLTQMTQIPVLALPELGKKHGFSASFSELAKATPAAFKLMRAVMAEGAKRGGGIAASIDGVSDMAITPELLRSSGLSSSQVEYLGKLIAAGKIDIGSAAREVGRISEGKENSFTDRATRWASITGLYSETLTRLIVALATKELHADGKVKAPLTDYAANVIDNAMFNYAASNTSRALGKHGPFGPMTQIMTQFMQFSAQLMEKLYRETHDAIKGDTAESRAEARKFLVAHATAVTALSGTLGLPFATMAAWAVEKLVNEWSDDDQPYDATAAYRTWLAGIFGKPMGEMLARGLPRAGGYGFDLSSRVGEQDLLPFSGFLTDRRSWRDAARDQSLRSFGAPAGMLVNIADGLDKISQGNVAGGAAEALPVFLKNFVGAYQMGTQGYVDAKGNALPISPTGLDILEKLMGVTPSDKAEYQEKASDVFERHTSIARQSAVLRNQLVQAALGGDHDGLRDLIRSAQKFDTANPKAAVLPGIEGAIKRRVNQTAIAKATNTPLGVAPDDLAGQRLVQY